MFKQHSFSWETHISKLQSITCHVGSPETGKHGPRQPQPDRPVLDLPTPERWKAELTLVLVVYQEGLPIQRQSPI